MRWKISSAKCRPFCFGLNLLIHKKRGHQCGYRYADIYRCWPWTRKMCTLTFYVGTWAAGPKLIEKWPWMVDGKVQCQSTPLIEIINARFATLEHRGESIKITDISIDLSWQANGILYLINIGTEMRRSGRTVYTRHWNRLSIILAINCLIPGITLLPELMVAYVQMNHLKFWILHQTVKLLSVDALDNDIDHVTCVFMKVFAWVIINAVEIHFYMWLSINDFIYWLNPSNLLCNGIIHPCLVYNASALKWCGEQYFALCA